MASPFEIAQGISNQFGKMNRSSGDASLIDNILSQSKGGAQPQDLMGQMLMLSPDKQKQAMTMLTANAKNIKDQQIMNNKRAAVKAYGFPESYADLPDSVLREVMNPIDRAKQQTRLDNEFVLKYYNSKIKEIDNDIKKARYSERPDLLAKKKSLQLEREKALNIVKELPAFDSSDPEMRQEAEDLMSVHKDINKVREILKEKYSGV